MEWAADEDILGSPASMMEEVEEASSEHADLAIGLILGKQTQAAVQVVEEERDHAVWLVAGAGVEEEEGRYGTDLAVMAEVEAEYNAVVGP